MMVRYHPFLFCRGGSVLSPATRGIRRAVVIDNPNFYSSPALRRIAILSLLKHGPSALRTPSTLRTAVLICIYRTLRPLGRAPLALPLGSLFSFQIC